jgi:hypothetical protein
MPVSILYDPHSQPHHFVSLTLKGLDFSVVCAYISISWFLSFRNVFTENCELNKYQWVLFWAPFPSVIGRDIAHVSFALTGMSQCVGMLNFLVHIEIWFIWIISCVSYCSSNWQLCTWICAQVGVDAVFPQYSETLHKLEMEVKIGSTLWKVLVAVVMILFSVDTCLWQFLTAMAWTVLLFQPDSSVM